MTIYSVYAAIPGREKVFFNSYAETQAYQAKDDADALACIGLEVEIRKEEFHDSYK